MPNPPVLPADVVRPKEEKVATTIPINDFDKMTDQFEEWVVRFERAVITATGADEMNRQQMLFRQWLDLKIDQHTLALLSGCKNQHWSQWIALKKELAALLISPSEVIRWKKSRDLIKWDGEECFQTLAHRVQRKVEKMEPALTGVSKEDACFQAFYNALNDYQDFQYAIDLACEKRDVESAVKVASRMVLSLKGEPARKSTKNVQFGAMADDRISIVEKDVAELKEKFGNMDVTLKKGLDHIEAKIDGLFKEWPKERTTSRERYDKHRDNRSPSRDGDRQPQSSDRRSPSGDRRGSEDRGRGYYMDRGYGRDNRSQSRGWDSRDRYGRGRSPGRDRYNRDRSSSYDSRRPNYYDYRDRNDRRRDDRRRESQDRRDRDRDRDRDYGRDRDSDRDRDRGRNRDRDRRGGYDDRDRRSSSRRSGESFASAKTDEEDEEERLMERLLQLRLSKN